MKFNIPFNRTKIIATVGPSSNTKEKLTELVKSGVDVFRLNFSHGDHKDHAHSIRLINEINAEHNLTIATLIDLQGPKIRTNLIENDGVIVESGAELVITTNADVSFKGTKEKISTSYQHLASDVVIGDAILIDDGKIELRVIGIKGADVHTRVIFGGPIKSKKGINLPDTEVSSPSLTEKDERDLKFGLEHNVDWVALSFVRREQDVIYLKNIIQKSGKKTKIISKIEKPQAVINIDNIIHESDAIMVARGDLGVEVVMEEVPMIQKMIVKKCNQRSRPVIIATQMMESMIEAARPTRAETNDVANAVMDGADAVMLSAETAAGKFPIQSVKSMSKTIRIVESEMHSIYNKTMTVNRKSLTFVNDSLVDSAAVLSSTIDCKAIVGITESGYTALKLAAKRPSARIFIFSNNKVIMKQLSLVWGVATIFYDEFKSTDETIEDIERILLDKSLLFEGDVFINVSHMPIQKSDRTNMMKISVVKDKRT